jgi:RNA-binding protein
MTLTGEQRRRLKSVAQTIKPIVQIGKQGLTDAQVENIERGLEDHELVKVKFNAFKSVKEELSSQIVETTGAERVDIIGNTLILYRMSNDPEKRMIAI